MKTGLFDLKIDTITGWTMEQCTTCRDWHNGDRDSWYQKHSYQELETVKYRKHRVREEAREYVSTIFQLIHVPYVGNPIRMKSWILSKLVGEGNVVAALRAEIATCIARIVTKECQKTS